MSRIRRDVIPSQWEPIDEGGKRKRTLLRGELIRLKLADNRHLYGIVIGGDGIYADVNVGDNIYVGESPGIDVLGSVRGTATWKRGWSIDVAIYSD